MRFGNFGLGLELGHRESGPLGGGAVPVNTVAPAISLSGANGGSAGALKTDLYTCSNGTWDNDPVSYAYQWKRDGDDIGGATAQTYTLVAADVGTVVSCAVTASNATGASEPEESNATATVVDPVKLLCHYNEADASQTLVDSSSFARTISLLGVGATPAADTDQAKFGSASLKNSGGAFRGFSVPDHADFEIGNGPFTIDVWVYITSASQGNAAYLFGKWNTTGNQKSYRLLIDNLSATHRVRFGISTDGSGETIVSGDVDVAFSTNTWYHICVDFDGTTYRLYKGGVQLTTSTSVLTAFSGNALASMLTDQQLAMRFLGYLDELRFVKGKAMFAGAFTPAAGEYS